MWRGLVIGIFVLASACTDRRPAPNGVPYIIERDGGGQIISALADRARLMAWGQPVVIRDYCASVCVVFTTMPNACIEADARIGFHSSSVNRGPVDNPQMAKHMRAGVKRMFLQEWQFVPPDQIHWISAAEYKALDPQARICPT